MFIFDGLTVWVNKLASSALFRLLLPKLGPLIMSNLDVNGFLCILLIALGSQAGSGVRLVNQVKINLGVDSV
jgi:hypothetical protein